MIINAPAKINLDFEITGKLPNGLHTIQTTMQTIDICDQITVDLSDKLELTGAMVAARGENLILKAVWALQKYVGKPLPCHIHLDKTIPMGAGLGGGSSDAAAVLKALVQLYNLKLDFNKLRSIGHHIGSDIPFFLVGGKCMVEGTGELVTRLPAAPGKFLYLIFRPHKRLSTKEAYAEYDSTGKTFEQMAREKCPQLDQVFSFFKGATVSGKGPTCWVERAYYDAYVGEEAAYAVASGLDSFMKDWNGDFWFARPYTPPQVPWISELNRESGRPTIVPGIPHNTEHKEVKP